MKRVTVGVAGHVDHGKTALVQALTGTDTDRLKEEKERGMSIVLGFAHLGFPEGEIDLIDVPGHERFIKTMIAGATGIDAVVLVIEIGEMVKPQTVEHLLLTGLLGVRHGIVAITKSDLIPPEETDLRTLAVAEVRDFLRGTFLEDAPLIFTSARTGEGIEVLRGALYSLLRNAPTTEDDSPIHLPIDRVFSIAGYGVVVTGTLRRGSVRAGQSVEVVRQAAGRRTLRADIRGVQVHGHTVGQAGAGGRVAVNLRGVRREDIEPGDTLAAPGTLRPTRRIDAELSLSPAASKPVTKGQLARLYSGTSEGVVRVYPLDRSEIAPGETAPVQLRLQTAIAIPFRERFVLRTYSSGETMGGGLIADTEPCGHTAPDSIIADRVRRLAHGTIAEQLLAKIEEAAVAGRKITYLTYALALSPARVRRELSALPEVVVCGDTIALHKTAFEAVVCETTVLVERFHTENPAREGISKEVLRSLLPPSLPASAFNRVLETLRRSGIIETEATAVCRAGFAPALALGPEDRETAREIEEAFRTGGLNPPDIAAMIADTPQRAELYRLLLRSGALVAAEDRVQGRTVTFHREAIEEAVRLLQPHLTEKGVTASEANQILGTTRKFGIPLLEYFDRQGITKRTGDRRIAGPQRSH